jgi:hypothetical protein
MVKLVGGLLAFMTLRLMLLPLSAVLLYAGACFIWFRPPEAAPQAADRGADAAHVVPVAGHRQAAAGPTEPEGFSDAIRRFAAGWRVLIWVAAVAGLPFAGAVVVRWAVGRDSNAASSALLIGLTALAILLCLLLMGFRLDSGWEIGLLTVAAILAAVYNFVACQWLAGRCAP